MRGRRPGLIAAAAVALLLPLLTASGASAESRSGNAYLNGQGDPTAEARQTGGGVAVGAEPDAAPACTWVVVVNNDRQFQVFNEDGSSAHSETGRWLMKVCGGVRGALIPERKQQTVSPVQLALEARSSVPVGAPPIVTSPASGRLVTRVPTWLWVDPAWWHAYSATASAGGVSTTVTARPVRAVWTTGDGARVACGGPGVVWQQGMADDETYCSHTYTDASSVNPSGAYTLSVTVEFDVSWSSTAGGGGTLAQMSRTASKAVVVSEIQAVGTR